jgi:hypothetical protein
LRIVMLARVSFRPINDCRIIIEDRTSSRRRFLAPRLTRRPRDAGKKLSTTETRRTRRRWLARFARHSVLRDLRVSVVISCRPAAPRLRVGPFGLDCRQGFGLR